MFWTGKWRSFLTFLITGCWFTAWGGKKPKTPNKPTTKHQTNQLLQPWWRKIAEENLSRNHERICRRKWIDFLQNLFWEACKSCSVQPPAELAALNQEEGCASPGQNSRACRARCGVFPRENHLVVKPWDSLTNTEERLISHGRATKLSLSHPAPFSAKPYLATLMEISSFLKPLYYFHSSAKVVLTAMDNSWLPQEYSQKQLIITGPHLETLNTGLAPRETNTVPKGKRIQKAEIKPNGWAERFAAPLLPGETQGIIQLKDSFGKLAY